MRDEETREKRCSELESNERQKCETGDEETRAKREKRCSELESNER